MDWLTQSRVQAVFLLILTSEYVLLLISLIIAGIVSRKTLQKFSKTDVNCLSYYSTLVYFITGATNYIIYSIVTILVYYPLPFWIELFTESVSQVGTFILLIYLIFQIKSDVGEPIMSIPKHCVLAIGVFILNLAVILVFKPVTSSYVFSYLAYIILWICVIFVSVAVIILAKIKPINKSLFTKCAAITSLLIVLNAVFITVAALDMSMVSYSAVFIVRIFQFVVLVYTPFSCCIFG